MNFQNSLRSRFKPLAPLLTQVIPPAPQDSKLTVDSRVPTAMQRLIPLEASLIQRTAASPTHGLISLEDRLLALNRARVALPASLSDEARGASASFRDHFLALIAISMDYLKANPLENNSSAAVGPGSQPFAMDRGLGSGQFPRI
jgi:hypothetical protein